MKTGDFAPYGKFNPNTGPSAGGGMAQPQEQQGQGGGMQQDDGATQAIQQAVPQPGTPQWLEHVPPGLMEMFQLAPTVGGLGQAFLQKYGHKFEQIEGAEKLAGVLGQSGGFGGEPQPVNYDEMEDEELLDDEDPFFMEAETGALIQSINNTGLGGLLL